MHSTTRTDSAGANIAETGKIEKNIGEKLASRIEDNRNRESLH